VGRHFSPLKIYLRVPEQFSFLRSIVPYPILLADFGAFQVYAMSQMGAAFGYWVHRQS
jgi:hypothetical protein